MYLGLSAERSFIELLELVEATVPIVENLVEVYEIHGDLLDKVLAELVLVYIHVHICDFRVLFLESV